MMNAHWEADLTIPEPNLGSFHLHDDEGECQEGVISFFLGPNGEQVAGPHGAATFVGWIVEGSWAGRRVECPIHDEDDWTFVGALH